MPDDLLPAEDGATATEVAETPAETDDSVYDDAASELLSEGDEADEAAEPDSATEEPEETGTEEASDDAGDAETETEPDEDEGDKPDSEGTAISKAEAEVLKRCKIPEEFWKHMSRDAVEQLVSQQRELDRLQAERGRQKEDDPEEGKSEPKEEAQVDYDDDLGIESVMNDLAKSYDEDIKPLGGVLTKLDQRARTGAEVAKRLPNVEKFLTSMAIDLAVDGVTSDYPSATKPEARQKLIERFWGEYNSGSYEPGLSSIKEAMREAAKVQFAGVTETEAAASLVEKNKTRVAAQPKTGTGKRPPKKPMSEDDVYDAAAGKFLTD